MFLSTSPIISSSLKSWQVPFENFSLANMNSVTTVIFCNCTIAIVVFVVTLKTVQFRKQIVALTNWCDRWTRECEKLSALDSSPSSPSLGAKIAASSDRIFAVRQLYQQQLRTLDLIRSIGSIISFARSLSKSRQPSQRKSRR